jgi:simple sugar transport system substrate-binding protein
MSNPKRVAILAALAVGTILIAASAGTAARSQHASPAKKTAALKFAMITHGDPSDPFFAVVKNGENAAAKSLGVTATYQSSANPQTEIQYIQAAVNQHVNGLAIAYDNPAVESAVKKAAAAGIPVYGLNSGLTDFPANGEVGYVGQDEGIAGQAVGNALNKVGGITHVLCVIHYAGAVNLEQRCGGVKATFKGTVTNINVPTNDLAADEASIKSKLAADKSINGVVTLGFGVAQVAEKAIAAAGSKAKLATFDLSASALKDVTAGKLLFCVDQQPYLQGYLPIQFLYLWNKNLNIVGGGKPVLTGPNLIMKDTAGKVVTLAAAGTR